MINPKLPTRLHYGFIIVGCCCLMMGINVGLTFSCAGIFYQPVSAALGVPVGEFGIYMSVMYVTSTLMLSVAGGMLERWSARWLFTLNSALMGCTFVAMSLFTRVWEFYVAGGVLGVTLAFLLYLSFPTLVNRWFKSRIGMMIGICSAASGIGGMIFNPMAGWIIASYGWRWGYASFGLIILLTVTPLLAILLRDRPQDIGLLPYGEKNTSATAHATAPTTASGTPYSKALRMPAFYLTLLFAFLMMGASTLNLFIPNYVTDHGFSLEQASLTAAAVMAGVTIGKIALGYINDRNCLAGVAVTTLSGIGGLLAIIGCGGSFLMILSGAFLFGWAYAGVTVQSAMLTRTIFGSRDYARIYSNISIALAAGGALASGGWGLLADATSFSFTFLVGAAVLGVCALAGAAGLIRRRMAATE
ncbi:MAG: MFS transporter [Muribaculaceae bacterium]|nr:MFS transporter [Muribaculaceae bacterium]